MWKEEARAWRWLRGKGGRGRTIRFSILRFFQGTEQGADFEISMKTILMRLFVGRGVNFDQSDR